jgi:hypothetical protein
MEVDGVFLNVRFDRNEILIDEARNFIVGIRFGLQPNARPSSRSSAEVEQQGLLVSLCLSECHVDVFVPLNSHFQSLLETKSQLRANSYPSLRGLQEGSHSASTLYQLRKIFLPGSNQLSRAFLISFLDRALAIKFGTTQLCVRPHNRGQGTDGLLYCPHALLDFNLSLRSRLV